ncbi:MAG: DNA translocase FtsK 4TM domain-containing protein [Oscillospiraceae bacterium]|nr:DNA translocase FtsK 4TM domain-containing protein [Oscillospiraceae bacterium]
MAQKTSTNKKSGAPAKKPESRGASASRRDSAPPPPPASPHRREIAGFIFFFASVFLLIGMFNNEGSVIVFGTNLIKSLIGFGFWLTAPVFFIISCILVFHRGKPVSFRVFSMLMLPVLFATAWHILNAAELPGEFELKSAVEQLHQQGIELKSGGIIGGLLGIGLKNAFSKVGAFFLLLVLFGVFLIFGLKINVSGMASKIKERATVPYEVEEDPAPAQLRRKEPGKPEPAPDERRAAKRKAVDIPLGDDEEILPLRDLSAAAVPESKKARVKKKDLPEIQTVSPTERVDPLDLADAASIAGVPLDPAPEKATVVPRRKDVVPAVASINDPPRAKKLSREEVAAEAQAVADTIADRPGTPEYRFPPLELLHGGVAGSVDYRDEVRVNRERLEGALHSFGISSAIVGVIRGPTVTRYDIELEQGVKLSRVTNLAGDLALALGVVNVRIAPIPDKISTVGIEVPNKIVSTVYLRDILDTPKFLNAKSKISFALGKDISGEGIVGNIAKLPHLLIAGTTGSGKSVCMNSLILSILFKARPDEVRLIMIDPKMVELGIYNGIPHLFVPVVTDPKKAAGALQWSVVEMLKRYRLFSEAGVRDLESYNRHCEANGEAKLPQVVIVIDELADLMMAAAKEVEESICRVAQMGRAAGMHLIIATQRPSADVITGLMKANVPSRIAFAVSSAMESRIILDQAGAEKLVGMGDMLYSPVGVGKPIRVQGAFVSDEERESVVQFIKENSTSAEPDSDIEGFMKKASEESPAGDSSKDAQDGGPAGEYDEMLPQAVEAVLEAKSCSVSMLQRRVKLGYSRAARIVDQMEEIGVIGPFEGSKPRQILITRDQWLEMQAIHGTAPIEKNDSQMNFADLQDDDPDTWSDA